MSIKLTAFIYPDPSNPIVIQEVGTFIKIDDDEKIAFSRIVVDPIPLTSGDPIQVIYKLYF
jgi:hypothetical protein